MKRINGRMAATCGLVMASAIFFSMRGVSAASEISSVVKVCGGTATFDAATNIPSISVRGNVTDLGKGFSVSALVSAGLASARGASWWNTT